MRTRRILSAAGAGAAALVAAASLSGCQWGSGPDITKVSAYPPGEGNKTCPSGDTLHLFIEAGVVGYKRFSYRGAGEVHWVNTSDPEVQGFQGEPALVDTGYRSARYQFRNYGDNSGGLPATLNSSNTVAFCQ